jgi:hypothetical protein
MYFRWISLLLIFVPENSPLRSPLPSRSTLIFSIHFRILIALSPRVCIEPGHDDMREALDSRPWPKLCSRLSVDGFQRAPLPTGEEPSFSKTRLRRTTAAQATRPITAKSPHFLSFLPPQYPYADAPAALRLRGGEATTTRQVGRVMASGGLPPLPIGDFFTQNTAPLVLE